MATRASIKFKDSDGNFIANVYHHWDGYPSGLGAKLLELTGDVIVDPNCYSNGFGCLVASVIKGLKDGPGGVYLYSESEYGGVGEEYLYEVVESDDGCQVLVSSIYGNDGFVPVEIVLETVKNN